MKKKTKERISNILWMLAISLIGTSMLVISLIK